MAFSGEAESLRVRKTHQADRQKLSATRWARTGAWFEVWTIERDLASLATVVTTFGPVFR